MARNLEGKTKDGAEFGRKDKRWREIWKERQKMARNLEGKTKDWRETWKERQKMARNLEGKTKDGAKFGRKDKRWREIWKERQKMARNLEGKPKGKRRRVTENYQGRGLTDGARPMTRPKDDVIAETSTHRQSLGARR
ncbi:hypothetical protein BaRGS_00027295 [Batillaria attramentaria]|uniref:Uncharacterized protein n=1 Tax=Batillaria attramentaria TaxID=370345 RepID=A0ABD0K2I8_9CAEN